MGVKNEDMARYYHTYPTFRKKRMQNYARLFNAEDNAKLAYNRDMAFRKFVKEWNTDCAELLGWTLEDFYRQYKSGQPLQLSLSFA